MIEAIENILSIIEMAWGFAVNLIDSILVFTDLLTTSQLFTEVIIPLMPGVLGGSIMITIVIGVAKVAVGSIGGK